MSANSRQALYPKTTKYIIHEPTPKQAIFMLLPQIEAMYGGQAGGGKSDAILASALQYVDIPGYSALILRKTYKELTLPEALMARAAEWLGGTDARWRAGKMAWVFPSGATLTFGYLDNPGSEQQYQSSAFQFIGFDELTQFAERQYLYMFSRLRKLAGERVPLRMRSATNPGNKGHDWVKARFVSPRNNERPFIQASLEDNPYIDKEEYLRALALLPPLERAWLEYGDWDATSGGTIAKREWFPIVEVAPRAITRYARFWDFAATEKKQGKGSNDPDYTVGTLMGELNGEYYVLDVIRGQWSPGKVWDIVKSTSSLDGRRCQIRWEEEGGSSGKFLSTDLLKELAGFDARGERPMGDKVTRAMPFIRQAEGGNVKLVRGAWNMAWLDEVTNVPISRHDDQWDSAAGAFKTLATPRGWSRGVGG